MLRFTLPFNSNLKLPSSQWVFLPYWRVQQPVRSLSNGFNDIFLSWDASSFACNKQKINPEVLVSTDVLIMETDRWVEQVTVRSQTGITECPLHWFWGVTMLVSHSSVDGKPPFCIYYDDTYVLCKLYLPIFVHICHCHRVTKVGTKLNNRKFTT